MGSKRNGVRINATRGAPATERTSVNDGRGRSDPVAKPYELSDLIENAVCAQIFESVDIVAYGKRV